MRASQVVSALKKIADPKKAKLLAGFFKTGKGEYGEGDIFIGVMVPQQRLVAKKFVALPLPEIEKLLASAVHEIRLTGLLILVYRFEQGTPADQKKIFDFYLRHRSRINNWDLVDVTTPKIVGAYLMGKPHALLYRLVKSKNIWERRMAVLATFPFIAAGQFDDSLSIATLLLTDTHDLMHKSVGWMLREIGKRDMGVLKKFLATHAHRMPRTMLRYAIEHFSKPMQRAYRMR